MNALVSMVSTLLTLVMGWLDVNSAQFASLVVAAVVFPVMLYGVYRGSAEQNLATYALWAVLDTIQFVSALQKGGNWKLAAFYAFVGVVTSATIWKIAHFEWTKMETWVTVSVVVCMVAWYYSGPTSAVVISTLGMFLAGTAQIKDAWLEPEKSPLGVYVGSTIANLLSTAGGRSWAIEERFYPLWCTVLTGLVVVVTLRRYLPEPVETK